MQGSLVMLIALLFQNRLKVRDLKPKTDQKGGATDAKKDDKRATAP
jgi:hypothetical protein